ncbi:hypothetical protein CAOG_01168 [Capsaspora owczarzaki ATCC 30864]|uniref:hypothetical protein n=1 Tax=Capsaspora owczarzaki (strain ATCC 30864) TaxID=595528 RepID=UPI000352687F|nr:hypothetical protein CAOG_01168 [Capsaspora owczarzaki ATCC 30864]|eukprot:XP_004366039.2 hypothetical protein CAOG_01168 [Capsaspora owczarzaki ATCC 30864]
MHLAMAGIAALPLSSPSPPLVTRLAALALLLSCVCHAALASGSVRVPQFVHLMGAQSAGGKTGELLVPDCDSDALYEASRLNTSAGGGGVVLPSAFFTAGRFAGTVKLDDAITLESDGLNALYVARFAAQTVVDASTSHFETSAIPSVFASAMQKSLKVFDWAVTIKATSKDGALSVQRLVRFTARDGRKQIVVTGLFSNTNLTIGFSNPEFAFAPLQVDEGTPRAFFVLTFEADTGKLVWASAGKLSLDCPDLSPSIIPVPAAADPETGRRSTVLLAISFCGTFTLDDCVQEATGDGMNSVVLSLSTADGNMDPEDDGAVCGVHMLYKPENKSQSVRILDAVALPQGSDTARDIVLVGSYTGAPAFYNQVLPATDGAPLFFAVTLSSDASDPDELALIHKNIFQAHIENVEDLRADGISLSQFYVTGSYHGLLKSSPSLSFPSRGDTSDAFIASMDLTSTDNDVVSIPWVWRLGSTAEKDELTKPAIGGALGVAVSGRATKGTIFEGIVGNERLASQYLYNTAQEGDIVVRIGFDGQLLYENLFTDRADNRTYIADLALYRDNNMILTGHAQAEVNFARFVIAGSNQAAFLGGLLFCANDCLAANRIPCRPGSLTCRECQFDYEITDEMMGTQQTCALSNQEETALFSGTFATVSLAVLISLSIGCAIFLAWRSRAARTAVVAAKVAATRLKNRGKAPQRYRPVSNRDEFELLSQDAMDDEDEAVFDVTTTR